MKIISIAKESWRKLAIHMLQAKKTENTESAESLAKKASAKK
jgi:hypothetical protein